MFKFYPSFVSNKPVYLSTTIVTIFSQMNLCSNQSFFISLFPRFTFFLQNRTDAYSLLWSGVSCQFSEDDGERQVRVSEDTPPGTQIFKIKAFPRRLFTIQALDGVSQLAPRRWNFWCGGGLLGNLCVCVCFRILRNI